MTPHGEFSPDLGFDPANYPHRALLNGYDPDAATVIAWTPDGIFDMDFAEVVGNVVARGGHVLILATTAEARDLGRGAILALVEVMQRGMVH